MGKYKQKRPSVDSNKKKSMKREISKKSYKNAMKAKRHQTKGSKPTKAYSSSDCHYSKSCSSSSSYSSSDSSSSSSSSSSQSPNYKKSFTQSQSSMSSLSPAARRHRVQHYRLKIGEMLDKRYKVKKLLGDGTFGRVVECKYKDKIYAVKIIKPVEKYINSAKIERSIIKRINQRDLNDNHGIVRYIESFYHRECFCMVFKPLGKSLYDFLKMNKFKGFPLPLVQSFFRQILTSIGFLHKIGYTHTDLKPQNVLLEGPQYIETDPSIPHLAPDPKENHQSEQNPSNSYYLPVSDKVRIIDFGGATRFDDFHSTIINTRQYRAPEVILQCCQWKQISDIWAIGCIICELYTGELLFPGYDDQQHLAMIQKNSGKFPRWMIEKIPSNHEQKKLFQDGFINQYKLLHVQNIIGMKTIEDIFPEQKQLIQLLHLCLQIDPNKRINCIEALKHPFFSVRFQ